MRGNFVNIKKFQSLGPENFTNRVKREIRKMFMVDGIKLVIINQLNQVREFHGNDTIGLENALHSAYKIIDIRHMREYIIA